MRSTYNSWYHKQMFANEAITRLTNRAEEILDESNVIAIVGLSRNRHKDSQFVARYLQNGGYTIVPVNPTADEILGEKAYPDLTKIPFKVDSVVVFLPPKIIPNFIDQAFQIHPKGIWLQLGTGEQPEAVEKAKENKITLFENRCVKVDHQFLIRPKVQKKSTS